MRSPEYAQYLGLTIEDAAMKIALECVSRLEEEIGKYAVVGGVAVQLWTKHWYDDYRKFLRRTRDVDVITEKRVTKREFFRILRDLSKEYEVKGDEARTCYEIVVKDDSTKAAIHIPRLSRRRYEREKMKIRKSVENSTYLPLDDLEVNVGNEWELIESKLRRSLYHSKNPRKVLRIIKKMGKLIRKDPYKAQSKVYEAYIGILETLHTENFHSPRVQRKLTEWKLLKDAYDISLLEYISPCVNSDFIETRLAELID